MRSDYSTQALNKFDKIPGDSRKKVFERLLKSNLDFKNLQNNYDKRHSWHAFPAKFPADLPRIFIENLTQIDDIILDPMAGSCTTLIEAALLQRQAIGLDIDPLSLIVGKAKFQRFKLEVAYHTGNSVLRKAKDEFDYNKNILKNKRNERFDKETLEFLDYWFLKETQLELLALLQEIERVEDDAIKRFLMSVFSGVIITKSGGVTLARDLAHTRPHKVESKIHKSAFPEFYKKLFNNLQDFENLPDSRVLLKEADAQKMPLKDERIDLIVTSPPYANNAIDYMRAHKFSLVWFGYKISDLKGIRKIYLGSETVLNFPLDSLPDYSNDIVVRLKKANQKKGKALHRYYSEMSGVIKEMYRVLKHGRACVIIVASSVLSGLDVEAHLCLAEIGRHHGFDVVHIGERSIDRNKRMMPTSHTKTNSQIETRMHNEYVIGFWKP